MKGVFGSEGGDEPAARIISVGFVDFHQIGKREDGVIYVSLEKHGNDIGAAAVSTGDFIYRGFNEKSVSNMRHTVGGPVCNPPYTEFIQMLARENRAIINYTRALKEGVDAHNSLEEMLREAANRGRE